MKKVFVIVLVIISVAVWIYFQLGGGQNLIFQQEDLSRIEVVGYYVEGKYNDAKAKKAFYDAKNLLTAVDSNKLVVINYPSDSAGLVKQFIGVAIFESLATTINDTETRSIKEGSYITTIINSHNLVMPSPEAVRDEAINFAKGLNLELENLSVEMYLNERDLRVAFPIK